MSPATGKRVAGPHVTISIRVQPRASRNAVVGWTGDTLNIRLTAPPVEGAANRACLQFLAEILDVAPSRISLEAGEKSREKRFRVAGLTSEAARAKIDEQLGIAVPARAGQSA